jgi:hypothetical protein
MREVVLSVLLISGGAAVFVLGNPYYTVFPTNGNQHGDKVPRWFSAAEVKKVKYHPEKTVEKALGISGSE